MMMMMVMMMQMATSQAFFAEWNSQDTLRDAVPFWLLKLNGQDNYTQKLSVPTPNLMTGQLKFQEPKQLRF